MHVRTQIRQAVATLLAGSALAGSRVYPSRLFSLDETELPSISVYTTDDSNLEQVTRISLGKPPRLHRALPLIVEGHVIIDEKIDDTLDQMALEIEQCLSNELLIGVTTISTQLVSTQMTFSGEGELQVGVVRMVYALAYSTLETTPDSLQ